MLRAEPVNRRETAHRLARRARFGFTVIFVLARICVFFSMSDEMPHLYLFLHGAHVHHLNCGRLRRSAVCGDGFARRVPAAEVTGLWQGMALGLTFDEFGMWLPLGSSYRQPASVDVVIRCRQPYNA